MAYADNEHKIRGIKRDPIVAERFQESLQNIGIKTSIQHSSLFEDKHEKFDYRYTCLPGYFFNGDRMLTELKIDVKAAFTYTLIDEYGNIPINNSSADYIVFELYENCPYLLCVDRQRLKDCIKLHPPQLIKSKFNSSKYFKIEPYVNEWQGIIRATVFR